MINQADPGFQRKTQSMSVMAGHMGQVGGLRDLLFGKLPESQLTPPQYQHGKWSVHSRFVPLIEVELLILQSDLLSCTSFWSTC